MQLTVQFVNQPNKNPKFGSIKATDGNYYDISADHLHKYRNGMTFDAPVKEREYKGKTYYSIPDSFDPTGMPTGISGGYSPPTNGVQQSPNGHVANNGVQQRAPALDPHTGMPAVPGHHPVPPNTAGYVNRDVSITQQTLLKAFIGTGQFGLTDLPMLEEACTASAKRLVKAAS